jgi:hypothetical protein
MLVSIASELAMLPSSPSFISRGANIVEEVVWAFPTALAPGGDPVVRARVRVQNQLLLMTAAELRIFLNVCHPAFTGLSQYYL